MSDKAIFILRAKPHPVRANLCALIMEAPDGYLVTIQPPKRSLQANAKMWCLLSDLAKQVDWYGRKLSPDDWKDVLTASYRKQDAVPNVDGNGFVVLGMRTSQMSIGEMGELIEVIYAFGSERGVVWSEADEAK
jgi:hypothetical protein